LPVGRFPPSPCFQSAGKASTLPRSARRTVGNGPLGTKLKQTKSSTAFGLPLKSSSVWGNCGTVGWQDHRASPIGPSHGNYQGAALRRRGQIGQSHAGQPLQPAGLAGERPSPARGPPAKQRPARAEVCSSRLRLAVFVFFLSATPHSGGSSAQGARGGEEHEGPAGRAGTTPSAEAA